MNSKSIKIDDTSGAATELGYIFTFLLGVLLLSVFSIWTWDIETATRDRWNEQAVQMNLDDIAAAIERAQKQKNKKIKKALVKLITNNYIKAS